MAFNPATDIPNLAGKVILITGGNAGLGEAAIKHFAGHNPSKIWLAARSRSKAEGAIARIHAGTPNANIEFLELDLASLESIRRAATRFNAESPRLDILQLSGGVGAPPTGVSTDGYEISFATNYLGHAALTKLLLPKLLETAKQPSADVRIICMSSVGHKMAKKSGIAFSELKSPMKDWGAMPLYSQSMLARTHFAYKMAKEYPQITTISLHPGTVRTTIAERPTSSMMAKIMFKLLFAVSGVTPEEGAKNQVYLSVAKGLKNGAYYEPIGKENPGPLSYRDDMADELWNWTRKELSQVS